MNGCFPTRDLTLKQPRQIPRSLYDANDLHLATLFNEENQITLMPWVAQPFVQLVALLEAAGALGHSDNLRLDLRYERCSAGGDYRAQ